MKHGSSIYGIAISPDGKLLASGGDDKTVRFWDLEKASLLATGYAHTEAVNGVAFAPDGKTLATASSDGTVKLWDLSRVYGLLER